METTQVLITYEYDLVQTAMNYAMLLLTQWRVEFTTVRFGADILFSTYMGLARSGREGFNRLADRAQLSYRMYEDTLRVVNGKNMIPQYMNYRTGEVEE